MDDDQFRRLLDHLDRPWKGFRKVRKGVQKRIARHMESLGCRTLEEYLFRLHRSPSAREACERRMAVSISRFLRDRRLWEVLKADLLPAVIGTGADPVRVWSAGCAGGEEPYSLRIVWEEVRVERGEMPALDVLATDLDPGYLDRCRRGVYQKSSLREVDHDLLERYFIPRGRRRGHRVRPELTEGITWRRHDLLHDPAPKGAFHLIFLRNNLLTYHPAHRAAPALRAVVDRLHPGGFLAVGAHEELPAGFPELAPYGAEVLYRKAGHRSNPLMAEAPLPRM